MSNILGSKNTMRMTSKNMEPEFPDTLGYNLREEDWNRRTKVKLDRDFRTRQSTSCETGK